MIERLRDAPIELVGRFADASNATLLVRLTDRDGRSLEDLEEQLGHPPRLDDLDPNDLAVYKPARGEAPLWDFPAGTLHLREVAAFVVSEALGWDLVPETVLREDGPFGTGSLQRFVPHDPQLHYFSLLESADAEVVDQLTAMVVFDLVIDNADRKGGHVLLEATAGEPAPGRLRLVDHGVSFHVERKLRTVAWDLAGHPVPADLRRDVAHLAARLDTSAGPHLAHLLADDELAALARRCAEVTELSLLPEPTGERPYPWPLL